MEDEEAILFDSEAFERMKKEWVLRPTTQSPRRRCCGLKKRVLWTLGVVSIVILTAVLAKKLPRQEKQPQPPQEPYINALRKALMFFNAQRSGALPKDNNVTWRGMSCMQDGVWPANFHANLSGGYFDGGDAVKSNFPTSFAMTLISWSVIEYGSKYQSAGELEHVQGVIKWGTDYFLSTFLSEHDTINSMVSQIGSRGSGGVPDDDFCWMRPEDIDYPRPVKLCLNDCPHLAAEMSAALASASIVFKDDRDYSKKLVHGAKTLYNFSESMSRKDSNSRSSTYWDEMLWGGAWLYYATGDADYLARVTSRDLAERAGAFSSSNADYGVFGWESKLLGAQLLLTRLRILLGPGYPYEGMLREFHNQTGVVMCSYLPNFRKFRRSKGGLIRLSQGHLQPLQDVANAAFLAALYSDYLEASSTPGWYCGPSFYTLKNLRDFSKSQMDYILGRNPRNLSYVVGFGERYPSQVHHRGASIPAHKKESCKGGWRWKDSNMDNPNIIQGALVAATDKDDGFQDVRTSSNYTEPTLVGNAGLVVALVALGGGGTLDKNGIFSAVQSFSPPSPPPPAPWTP
ncbi:PREDICTED: endoglucanase 21-like [Brassica oleracea var. oleracea]|uniref:Endoglucanase n=1 Tax=Brassica oleracea var. oleracea TaxID=109376 RepID=A0A0D3AYM9_BRAOL|nr:PREDICTED: endoglucanase 21-like [Brassica oleracea var. oleracea]